jgi:hypothetical protein
VKKPHSLARWFKHSGAFRWARRHRFTEPYFEPYAKAIGQLLLAWNDLHERLASLFVMAMGGGWVDRPLGIWHSVRSDYSKRRLLREAIAKLPDNEKANREKLTDEIEWILDASDKLEGLRDDSAHTPLHYLMMGNLLTLADLLAVSDIYQAMSSGVFPDTSFQNPRAMQLDKKKKDLLIECRYARERITVLRDYAIAIDAAWANARLAWPDRPILPERKSRQARRRRDGGSKQA